MENLNRALPELHQKIAEVQDLSKRVPPAGNMAESIWRIKDVIEETRNYVTTVRGHFSLVCFQDKRFVFDQSGLEN